MKQHNKHNLHNYSNNQYQQLTCTLFNHNDKYIINNITSYQFKNIMEENITNNTIVKFIILYIFDRSL